MKRISGPGIVLMALAVGAICWAPVSQAAPKTNVEALQELSRQFAEQWAAMRTPLYYELLSGADPAQRALNNSPDIELMYIDARGMPVAYAVENINAAGTISTDDVWPGGSGGFALNGAGMAMGGMGVWDAGAVLASHIEMAGRVMQMDSPGSTHYHSTHVAGTMIATGLNANAKGMSYAGTLAAYDWGSDEAEMAAAGAAGMNVSNHSYGSVTGWRWDGSYWYWWGDIGISTTEDYNFGFYDGQARDWDLVAYNAPYYTICKSAGNDRNDSGPGAGGTHFVWDGGAWVSSTDTRDPDCSPGGYDCISTKGVAKNIITVGAVADLPGGWTSPNFVSMSSFSGWGPTDDGRVKPDIVANGVSLFSTDDAGNNSYTTLSGTSMSSPNAAGSINLLVRHYESLHGGSSPLSSTVKAVVLHTADEAGAAGPDYRFGWGLMNTLKGAQLIQADFTTGGHLVEAALDDQAEDLYLINSDGVTPIRITMVWTDLPAVPLSAQLDPTDPRLVHDLDLRLMHVNGTTFEPYILDPANPGAVATFGDNTLDNVEQVYAATPPAGDYFVRVSHKGSISGGPQAYSLASSHPMTAYVCPVTMTGDVNTDAAITSADIIYLVTFVFKSGPEPTPCRAAGDVNCDGSVTSADIIRLVDFVFKGGPPPCDVCALIPAQWICL